MKTAEENIMVLEFKQTLDIKKRVLMFRTLFYNNFLLSLTFELEVS